MPSPVEPYHILTFCKKKLCGKNHEFRKILIPYFIFFLHKYFLQKVKVQAFSKSKWTGLETTCSLFSLKLYTCNHANLWLPLLFFLFLSCSIFIIAASLLLITFFSIEGYCNPGPTPSFTLQVFSARQYAKNSYGDLTPFLAQNDGKEWFRKKYFEIQWWPSELPVNLPGQFNLSWQIFLHWAAATLKAIVEF